MLLYDQHKQRVDQKEDVYLCMVHLNAQTQIPKMKPSFLA